MEQRGEQERRHDVETVHLGSKGAGEEWDTGDSGHLEPGHQRGVAAHHVQLRAGPRPGPAHLIFSEYNVPSITRTSIMQMQS